MRSPVSRFSPALAEILELQAHAKSPNWNKLNTRLWGGGGLGLPSEGRNLDICGCALMEEGHIALEWPQLKAQVILCRENTVGGTARKVPVQGCPRARPYPSPDPSAQPSSPRDWSLIRLVDSRVWMALAPRLEGDSRVAERGCLPGCLQISIPSAVQIRKERNWVFGGFGAEGKEE